MIYEYARLINQNDLVEVNFSKTQRTKTFSRASEAINELASLGFRVVSYNFGLSGNGKISEVYIFERQDSENVLKELE